MHLATTSTGALFASLYRACHVCPRAVCAVPYLLIQGPKGSGKSELTHLLSSLRSNSTIIGSGSHAFTAAQVDQARGLIVLDDRESLGVEDLDANLLEASEDRL